MGENYLEHLGSASSFGARLFVASLACFAHGLVPALFVKTGSRAVTDLYGRMVAHRDRRAPTPGGDTVQG